ncbi:hypothetical protein [Geoalkalibacter halelectricus]|uniref:hypothetical protein n=1 Tax=Geoalkalibacter halelectricus TaxID=2847045 RepID=UPI003D25C099
MSPTRWIIALLVFALAVPATASLTKTADRHWLTGADEKTRLERLEHYLGGFSSAMLETGLRYGHVRQAVADENWLLADYHWKKIADAIENGLMKRPARRANAEAMFLEGPWKALDVAWAQDDTRAVEKALHSAHQACLNCHVAEKVAFINDQPLLRKTPKLEEKPKEKQP